MIIPSEDLKRAILKIFAENEDRVFTSDQISDKLVYAFHIPDFNGEQTWMVRVKISEGVKYLFERGYFFGKECSDGRILYSLQNF